jgi:peptidoglycan-N-acetylglucosamine deacetylase
MSRALAAALAGAAVCALSAAASSQSLLIVHGARTRPLVALTFDADMTEGMVQALRSGRVGRWYDPAILAELRATRTPATIFMTGLWAETYPLVARSLARDPLFELENHSYDHAAWERPCYGLPSARTQKEKRDEVRRGAFALAAVTGVAPAYFRFPGGCANRGDVRLVAALGERPVQWDVISGDSYLRNPADVERQVLDGTRPGSIVVLHLVGAPNAPATAAVLKEIIPRLRSRGLRFVKLRRLLSTTRPAQRGA